MKCWKSTMMAQLGPLLVNHQILLARRSDLVRQHRQMEPQHRLSTHLPKRKDLPRRRTWILKSIVLLGLLVVRQRYKMLHCQNTIRRAEMLGRPQAFSGSNRRQWAVQVERELHQTLDRSVEIEEGRLLASPLHRSYGLHPNPLGKIRRDLFANRHRVACLDMTPQLCLGLPFTRRPKTSKLKPMS